MGLKGASYVEIDDADTEHTQRWAPSTTPMAA